MSSASVYLALLNESIKGVDESGTISGKNESNALLALEKLNSIIETNWSEIALSVAQISSLADLEDFKGRQLAALITAKLLFYIDQTDEALEYVLLADKLFVAEPKTSIFSRAITTKVIEKYINVKSGKEQAMEKQRELNQMFMQMFDDCLRIGQYRLALSVAIDSEDINLVEHTVDKCPQEKQRELIDTAVHIALGDRQTSFGYNDLPFQSTTPSLLGTSSASQLATVEPFSRHKVVLLHVSPAFSEAMLKLLVGKMLHAACPEHPLDVVTVAKAYLRLNRMDSLAELLATLVMAESGDGYLKAFQIAFDLVESEMQTRLYTLQQLCTKKLNAIRAKQLHKADTGVLEDDDEDGDDATASMYGRRERHVELIEPTAKAQALVQILTGEDSNGVYLNFLHYYDHPDMLRLTKIKDNIVEDSMNRSAMLISNALFFFGTTHIDMLKASKDILHRISEWPRVEAISTMGMLYKYSTANYKNHLKTYLPKENGEAASKSAEGGALYALGLMLANRGLFNPDAGKYVTDIFESDKTPFVQHGSAVGLGLLMMGTADKKLGASMLEKLRSTEDATVGEGLAVGLGFLMLGSGDSVMCDALLEIAEHSKHQKIVRGAGYAVALTLMKCGEECQKCVERALLSTDPQLRAAAAFTLALAYAATAEKSAVRQLLQMVATDVSDTVKQAAAQGIGFVLCTAPENCLRTVAMLTDSYSPQIRCGAAQSLAIAYSGTGDAKVSDILFTMFKTDSVAIVKQTALIAFAMVAAQANTTANPALTKQIEEIDELCNDERLDTVIKFGAFVASGMLRVSGQNAIFSAVARTGEVSLPATAGLFMFTQHSNWYPYFQLVSLAHQPTAFIGLAFAEDYERIGVVENEVLCEQKPILNALKPQMKKEEDNADGANVMSSLSYNKSRAVRQKKKAFIEASGGLAMSDASVKTEEDLAREAEEKKRKEEERKKKEEEKTSEVLKNPFRLNASTNQQSSLVFPTSQFEPCVPSRRDGIVILRPKTSAPFSLVTMNHQPLEITKKVESTPTTTKMDVEKPHQTTDVKQEELPPTSPAAKKEN